MFHIFKKNIVWFVVTSTSLEREYALILSLASIFLNEKNFFILINIELFFFDSYLNQRSIFFRQLGEEGDMSLCVLHLS